MTVSLAPTPKPAASAAIASIVAAISVWLDAALTQYRGAGARAFFRAALLANVSVRPINVSMLGPPGTAKTAMGTAFANAFGGSFGSRTLSPWTERAELLGQVDLKALQDGRLEYTHDPAHPDLVTADTFLADEWPRSTGGIRALLLSVLADRMTPTGDRVKAHAIFAAANTRLTSEDDQAANDRYALRIEVPRLDNEDDVSVVCFREVPVEDEHGKIHAPTIAPLPSVPPGAIGELRKHAATVYFPRDIHRALTAFILALRQPPPGGVAFPDVSERRWILATRLLQASAALRGADAVDWIDLTETLPMVYDEGEASRAVVNAALLSSIPKWVGALRDLDALCVNAVERAYRVESGDPRKGEGDLHAKRDAELDQALATLSPFGADVVKRGEARIERARDEIDDAIERGIKDRKARRAGGAGVK